MGEPHEIQCVCFDWGGVILKICRHFADGAAAAGLDVRQGADNPDLYDVRRGLSAQYQVGALTEQQFFAGVSESFEGLYSPDEIARVHDAWLLEEYEGVSELVRELHEAGVTTALLSNTNARHWERRLADFPTAGTLKLQHASHLLQLAKPDAAIYTAFEFETGFAPSQILFFDDLAANIEAAQGHGWHAMQVDHEGDTAAQMRAKLSELNLLPG